MGLLHIAVPYYERVLESAPPPSAAASGALRCRQGWPACYWLGWEGWAGWPGQVICGTMPFPNALLCLDMFHTITCWLPLPPFCAGPSFDLRRDAAYNLSLIYKASGADALAKQLLRQHLTI